MQFNFTQSQSSSIASVNVEGQEVSISFQSNPTKEYTFVTENEDQIVEFLGNPGDASVGKMYHTWIREQVLIPTDALVAA